MSSISPVAGSDGFTFCKGSLPSSGNLLEKFLSGSRQGTASSKLYQDGVLKNTNVSSETSPVVSTTKITIGARGLTGDATADKYFLGNLKFACFGTQLTDAQVTALNAIVLQHQTDLGRA